MFSRNKAHICVKEPCIPMIATDCNKKQAHLCIKEPCIPMIAKDCNRKNAHLCVEKPCVLAVRGVSHDLGTGQCY